jgi:hypothetical protein
LFATMLQLPKVPTRRNRCAHDLSIEDGGLFVTILRETVTVLCEPL